MVPGSKGIAFNDFVRICLFVLDELGQLAMKPQPNSEEWPTLRARFVPDVKSMGMIAAMCDARVRAIKTVASERFVERGDGAPIPRTDWGYRASNSGRVVRLAANPQPQEDAPLSGKAEAARLK